MKPRVIVLRTAGTNCDKETAFAFELAGADAELVHVNRLGDGGKKLEPYRILAIPGGFTYGDDIASGKILANELKFGMKGALQKFIKDGKLIIGICNGFQILVKAGLLPNFSGDFQTIEATLTLNDSNKFEDRWVYLKKPQTDPSTGSGSSRAKSRDENRKPKTECVWTKGINGIITLPVAHGEGKFIPKNKKVLDTLKRKGLIVLKYTDEAGKRKGYPYNPNGSTENIAGICDRTGRIFGLMPHPERHISLYQHPTWTRIKEIKSGKGDGFAIFSNGVNFVKKYL